MSVAIEKLVFYLSFVTASLSFTVTETVLFQPLREWLQKHNSFLGKLFSCGYCFNHWVAFFLVALCRLRLFDLWFPLDYFFTVLVIAWLAGIQWGVMCWLMILGKK